MMPISKVSLVVIQFEINGEFEPIKHIHYQAPKIQKSLLSLDSSLKTNDGKPNKEVKKYTNSRGCREFNDITIETLTGDSKEPIKSNESDFKEQATNISKKSSFKNPNYEFMDTTKAIILLFKENQTTKLAEEAERSEMVCILAVPSEMTTSKLLHFTDSVCKDIEYIRVIRKSNFNYYMALIKFRNQLAADEFFKNFNGVPFNTPSALLCHIVYVAKVESFYESSNTCQPIPGHTELPACPECLERMDESVEGILTVNMQSSSWRDPNCLICKFCHTTSNSDEEKLCFECHSKESLWICVICGHIGCGRYIEGHAYNHYLNTEHSYAMQLGNCRIWDYAGDNYVHRLAQENTRTKSELHSEDDKLDSIQLEYTYLLTSQLEAQRHFFEDRIPRIVNENKRQLEEVKEKAKLAIEEKKQLETKLSKVTKEKQNQDKKISQLSTKYAKLLQDLKDEKDRNKALDHIQQANQQKHKQAEKQLLDLKAQNAEELKEVNQQIQDLKFYLKAQNQLQGISQATQDEIQEGHIIVGATASSKPTYHRHKRHR